MKNPKRKLAEPPKLDRLSTSSSDDAKKSNIDRKGGRYGAGVIYGVSVCSVGEALGHYMWCDGVFLDQIVAAGNANPKLLKSRFTHPDMCSDGMGKALGTISNIQRIGNQAIGDLHFYETSHSAPDGDLAEYVMSLAEEDPKNFGTSVVFIHDHEAEEEFERENTQAVDIKDDSGRVLSVEELFVSPDPNNTNNLPHARVLELSACDVVDDPAANPHGLFHRPNAMLSQASEVIEFVLGKSPIAPALSAFGAEISPERLKAFFEYKLSKFGLSLVEKGKAMPKKSLGKKYEQEPEENGPEMNEDDTPEDMPEDSSKCDDDQPVEQKPEETASDDPENEVDKADDDPNQPEQNEEDDPEDGGPTQSANRSLSRFCKAFGHEFGAKYLLEGLTFSQAQGRHIAVLSKQLKDANEKLSAFAGSGVSPVGFSAAPDKGHDKSHTEKKTGDSSFDNRSAFAAMNSNSKN